MLLLLPSLLLVIIKLYHNVLYVHISGTRKAVLAFTIIKCFVCGIKSTGFWHSALTVNNRKPMIFIPRFNIINLAVFVTQCSICSAQDSLDAAKKVTPNKCSTHV